MKILDGLNQGDSAWLAARASYYCASDAPPMMGASKNTTRTELVRMRANGDQKEFSDYVRERVIEPGHEIEALARPIVEAQIGESLYPVTAVDDTDTYLASFDGLTIDEETAWECKRANQELVAAVKAGEVPESHYWQCEHHFLVNPGIQRYLFTVSDGTVDGTITIEYHRGLGRREKLIAGWKQFAEDVKNYVHVEVAAKPVAEQQMQLPAIAIEVKGAIELVSNLPRVGEMLRSYLASIPAKPATDQEFANCEAAIKALSTFEERLEAAQESALARFDDLDAMRTMAASLMELARQNRLALDKLVKARKDEIRDEIRREGVAALAKHVEALTRRLGRPFMPPIAGKFAEVMKGRKTVDSLRDAVSTEVARVKIEASEVADRIEANLKALAAEAPGLDFLFADLAAIVQKMPDDFALTVRARVSDHQAKEAKRLEAERERIAKEEAAKAEAKLRAEQEAREKAQREDPQHTDAVLAAAAASDAPPYEINRVPAAMRYADYPAPRVLTTGPTTTAAKSRPSDDEIIAALAMHYRVERETVITWLMEIDLAAASARLVKHEFAA